LQVQWPYENQQARGLLLTRSATAVSAEISRRDLGFSVSSGIQQAANALRASVAQLQSATVAVNQYTRSLANEQTKRRLGAATLIDVLNVEDRLTAAQQNEILGRQAYANSLAQLLFESGTLLLKRGENEFEVSFDGLLRYQAQAGGKAER
jgi:outer membrane protein TolC